MKVNLKSSANEVFIAANIKVIDPFSQNVITEDELNRVKGKMSFNKEILLIEYLGDLYIYRRKSLGKSIYYEYSYNLTYD